MEAQPAFAILVADDINGANWQSLSNYKCGRVLASVSSGKACAFTYCFDVFPFKEKHLEDCLKMHPTNRADRLQKFIHAYSEMFNDYRKDAQEAHDRRTADVRGF